MSISKVRQLRTYVIPSISYQANNQRNKLLSFHSPTHFVRQNYHSTVSSTRDNKQLHIGIVGLGAIGTIFFTKFAALAKKFQSNILPVSLKITAFIKPTHYASLLQQNNPKICLQNMEISSNFKALKTSNQCISLKSVQKIKDINGNTSNAFLETESEGDDINDVQIHGLDENHEMHDFHHSIDILFITVKAYDSIRALKQIQNYHPNLLTANPMIILVQNGFQDTNALNEIMLHEPNWKIMKCVTYIGGSVVSFGQIIPSGLEKGMTYIAPFIANNCSTDDEDYRLDLLSKLFYNVKLQMKILSTNDMATLQWKKLIANTVINTIATLLNAPNECIVATKWSRDLVENVIKEAAAIASLENIDLQCSNTELTNEVLQAAEVTGSNICSMLADVRNQRRTEIDAIVLPFLSIAQRENYPTPILSSLYMLIKAREASYIK